MAPEMTPEIEALEKKLKEIEPIRNKLIRENEDITKLTPEEGVKRIIAVLEGRRPCVRGIVDWLEQPRTRKLLEGRRNVLGG